MHNCDEDEAERSMALSASFTWDISGALPPCAGQNASVSSTWHRFEQSFTRANELMAQ